MRNEGIRITNVSMPRVAIVYLCYGMRRYLDDVVESVENLDYPKEDLGFVLVASGSPDAIEEQIREQVLPKSNQSLPRTVLLDDGENRGFAGNNNKGMEWALREGYDYVYLLNGDAKLDKNAIKEAVQLAEEDERIGAVQSLVLFWNQPKVINVSGGIVHVAGYGYARDNGALLTERSFTRGEELAYPSGAATLYRASALKQVGLLEEGFFMYHEDLELGLRLKISGYKNVLAPDSLAFHDYQFSRNPKKFAWMELYRWIVILAYFRVRTLILLLPLLLVIELGVWMMALKGGWIKAKLWACRESFRPTSWRLLFKMRKRMIRLRVVSDREWMRLVSGEIVGQETESFIVQKVANPVITALWKAAYFLIRW